MVGCTSMPCVALVHDIVNNRKKGDMLCHPGIRIQVLICMRQENE